MVNVDKTVYYKGINIIEGGLLMGLADRLFGKKSRIVMYTSDI